MITYFDLPKFQAVDEWEKEIEKITVVYRIKSISDSQGVTLYFATCWQRGVPSYSANKKFDERPSRIQVEIRLGEASAEIVRRAVKGKHDEHLLSYKTLASFQKNLFESVSARIEMTVEMPIRHNLEMQAIFKKSDWLVVKSDEIKKASTELSERLAILNERSRQLCRF